METIEARQANSKASKTDIKDKRLKRQRQSEVDVTNVTGFVAGTNNQKEN